MLWFKAVSVNDAQNEKRQRCLVKVEMFGLGTDRVECLHLMLAYLDLVRPRLYKPADFFKANDDGSKTSIAVLVRVIEREILACGQPSSRLPHHCLVKHL